MEFQFAHDAPIRFVPLITQMGADGMIEMLTEI